MVASPAFEVWGLVGGHGRIAVPTRKTFSGLTTECAARVDWDGCNLARTLW